MTEQLARYRTPMEDSTRWDGFECRSGDIVMGAPSKSGTTWTQMICALLIFQTPDLPAPLTTLSPWIDMRVRPKEEVWESLAAQRHRRFIKTHTPLDGLPRHDDATYIAVIRHPLDVALSDRDHVSNVHRRVRIGFHLEAFLSLKQRHQLRFLSLSVVGQARHHQVHAVLVNLRFEGLIICLACIADIQILWK